MKNIIIIAILSLLFIAPANAISEEKESFNNSDIMLMCWVGNTEKETVSIYINRAVKTGAKI